MLFIAGLVYFCFLSFTSAFALSEYLQLYVLASGLLAIVMLTKLADSKTEIVRVFSRQLQLYALFVASVLLVSLFSDSEKSLSYFIVYLFAFLVSPLLIAILLSLSRQSDIFIFILLPIAAVSVFSILEFSFYFYGIELQDSIPRIGPLPSATMFGIKRSFGFSNEPLNLAMYFVSFIPIVVCFCSRKINFAAVTLVLLLIAAVTTLSSVLALYLIIISFYLIALCTVKLVAMTGYLKVNKKVATVVSLCLFTLVLGYASLAQDAALFVSDFFAKAFLLDQTGGSGRSLMYKDAFPMISFIPHGAGALASQGLTFVNWYLELLYDFGLPSLMIYLAIVCSFCYYILGSQAPINPPWQKHFFAASFIALNVIQACTSVFYYPYIPVSGFLALWYLNRSSIA